MSLDYLESLDVKKIAEDLEFMTRALNLLTQEELKELMSRAAKDGYVISGFRDVRTAPLSKVLSSMKMKQRSRERGKNLAIMVRCMEEMDGDIPELCRKKRHKGEEFREEAEAELIRLEEKRRQEGELLLSGDGREEETGEELEKEEPKDEAQAELQKELKALGEVCAKQESELETLRKSGARQKQKIESLEQKLRTKRNESEDYEKQLRALQKDVNRGKKAMDELQQQIETMTAHEADQKKQLKAKENEIKELKRQIENLEKIKERLPNVLVYSKHKSQEIDRCVYNIIIKDQIEENERYEGYAKIFVVNRDFPYTEYGKLLATGQKVQMVRSLGEIVEQLS